MGECGEEKSNSVLAMDMVKHMVRKGNPETLLKCSIGFQEIHEHVFIRFLHRWFKYVHRLYHFTAIQCQTNRDKLHTHSGIWLIFDSLNITLMLIFFLFSGYIHQEENKALHSIRSGS